MSNNKCEAGTTNCSGKLELDEEYWNSAENTTHEKIYACNQCGIEIEREEIITNDAHVSKQGFPLGGKKIDGKINLSTSKSESDSKKFYLLVERTLKGKISGFNSPSNLADTQRLYLLANKKFPKTNSEHLLAVSAFHTLKKAKRPEQLFEICQVIYSGQRKLKQDLRLIDLAKIKKIERSANRLYNKLKKEEIITEANPTNPLNFVQNILHQVAKGTKEIKIYQKSKDNLKKMQDAELTAGKNPAGIGAALVYTSMIILNLHVKQSQIARISGVSDLCVRKNSKELFSLLERNSG